MRYVPALRAAGPGVLVSALLLSGCNQAPAPETTPAETRTAASADPAAGIKPAISFNQLMVKFVDQAADPIWNAAVTPPKTDAEWEQIEFHAVQLATTGTLLRVGGTGSMDTEWASAPDWAPFADKMTQAALAAAQAARNKDVAALQAAGDDIVLNCEGCHRAFKLELPTEGLATHLARGVITAEPKAEPAK
jgi:Cytochrome C'